MQMADTHSTRWHSTGHELLEEMLRTIGEAREAVCLETFTFSESKIGDRFRTALAAAARRGVQVRVLIDAFGSIGLPHRYFDELRAAGGEMRWFNVLRPSSFSFRDHRKLLVIDGERAFVGGCNIADEYHGDGITQGWRDGGVGVCGPVARVLATEFGVQWERALGKLWTRGRGRAGRRAQPSGLRGIEALFMKPGLGRNPLRDCLWKDLARSREVAITAAYFLPPPRLLRQLSQAVARGARVRLLLAGRSDLPLMKLASRCLYRRMLRQGVELWEYQPQVLHSKSLVIDDIVLIGSSNLDPRSLRINFEVMLRIEDAALAAGVREQFETDLRERAIPITRETLRKESTWWERLKQRLAYWLLARLDPEVAALKLQVWRRRRTRWVGYIRGERAANAAA